MEVGSLGKEIKYIIETDGTLTIYGNGNMNDYSWSSPVQNNKKVKTIEIHEGITHIGTYLFQGFSKVKEVYLPQSIESIGTQVFWESTSLQKVTIGRNVNKIQSNIFVLCSKLSEIINILLEIFRQFKRNND